MAQSVNFVWNFVNQTSMEYLDKKGKWLSEYELQKFIPGCSKALGIHSDTIQSVSDQYNARRRQHKKRKLAWRSSKRSNGWIPFKNRTLQVKNDTVTYCKHTFRLWLSRPIMGVIKCGQFSCDSKGNWFITFICDCPDPVKTLNNSSVGIDLGLKTIATLSTGHKLSRDNITKKFAEKLATAQRANKKRQVTNIHTKIRNIRMDWNHKQTTILVNSFGQIVVGDVSPSKLLKTKMSKSVADASWYDFKSMLKYKAAALGVEYKEINEKFSTVTCSTCLNKTGPSGLSSVGVRDWVCSSCGVSHDRDINSAINILRISHDTLIKGVPLMGNVTTTQLNS